MNQLTKLNELWLTSNPVSIKQNSDSVRSLRLSEQIAKLFSAGDFFYVSMDFSLNEIDHYSENAIDFIPFEKNLTVADWLAQWHPDDVAKVYDNEVCKAKFLFEFIDKDEIIHYQVIQKYRLKRRDGSYGVFLNQVSSLEVSDGKILRTLLVQTDVSHLSGVYNDRISFIHTNGGTSYYCDDLQNFVVADSEQTNFSERELEILKLTSEGKSAKEIGETLFIASSTVQTHKKNILKKSDFSNMTELICELVRNGKI